MKMKRPKINIPTSVKDPELVRKRRGQIIRAATKLFARKGFHKTTIRDIAGKSGLSLGAIYEYVRSKEEIIVLNQEVFLESAGAKLRRSIQHIENPLEKLRRLIRTELRMMDRHAEYLLFLTRERHYLAEEYMNKTLRLERARLGIFDEVLRECVQAGLIGPCNIGLTTQLIKVMIDAWVMKGWDLRDRTDLTEMEASILDLLWNGLPAKKRKVPLPAPDSSPLEGRTVFVANGGTPLGMAIVSFLASKGACPFVYLSGPTARRSVPGFRHGRHEEIRVYSGNDRGPLDLDLFGAILSDMKQRMDIYIHDLGIGNGAALTSPDSVAEAGRRLDANLICAQELAPAVRERMPKGSSSRCIYLAPWAWDRYANPVRYEAVKGAALALSRMMAGDLARFAANAHCIVPGHIRPPRLSGAEEGVSDELMDRVPPSDLGDISDVAHAVLFLVSDASNFLTGQVLHVSRGRDEFPFAYK